MSDGMRRELVYLSSHATNRYFIPNWGFFGSCFFFCLISTANLLVSLDKSNFFFEKCRFGAM